TVVGAVDATGALASVYRGEAQDDGTQPRPRAIVGSPGSRTIEKVSTTGWKLTGQLFLQIERDTPDEFRVDRNAGYDDFSQLIEAILDEMTVLAGQSDYLDVVRFHEFIPAMASDP